jgi:hypothetical protein
MNTLLNCKTEMLLLHHLLTMENNVEEGQIVVSPVPVSEDIPEEKKVEVPPVELSFPDAIREVLNGNKIMRLSWKDDVCFGLLKDTFLQIFVKGEYHYWTINDGDMTAIDWVVLPKVDKK